MHAAPHAELIVKDPLDRIRELEDHCERD